jgi:type II secretory ATPase GspE/PulE/Tfp pilus assembly ATPase PilB-like protein
VPQEDIGTSVKRDNGSQAVKPTIDVGQNNETDNFLTSLVRLGAIPEEDVAGLRTKYHTPEDVFDGLLKLGATSEEKLVKAYASYRQVDYTNLDKVKATIASIIPKKLAEKYQIVPFEFDKRLLKVAVAYPTRLARGNLSVLQEIEERSGVKLEISYTTSAAVHRVLSGIKGEGGATLTQDLKTNLQKIDLSQRPIPVLVINKIPQDIAEQYQMIVFESVTPTKIKVGMVNPHDKAARDLLKFIRDKNSIEIEEYQISEADFKNSLKYYNQGVATPQASRAAPTIPVATAVNPQPYITPEAVSSVSANATQNLISFDETNLDQYLKEKLDTPADLMAIIRTGNVPKMVAGIIKLSSLMKSSDVHIEAAKENVLVRYRIDGQLNEIVKIPIGFQKSVVARVKILAKLKIDEARIPQDGRFEVIVNKHTVDLRVSTMPAIYGEKVVLRLLDKNAGIFEMKTLGMSDHDLKLVVKAIEKPYGVLLVTGPTGSGKSTTLYAAINHLKGPTVNIVTLEDPVEYEMPGINQVQVKPQIGFTFAEGLRAVLRQDPNIIMVGEIRDTETASLVTHAALTGHVVLTTLHTNDAASAMPRLTNMGVEPFLISSAINAIMAQRLVRKICPECKQEIQVPPEVRAEVEKELTPLKLNRPIKFYQGKGCPKCKDGYKGRTGTYEVMEVTDEIEDLIIKRAPASQILEVALKQGMVTMRVDGFLKVIDGITTVDEVMQATMLN